MGRKKKPFIDKKHAQTFCLVPRSQQDPLCGDSLEAQHVLQPETQVNEQQKYGIYCSDDYDYLQHLREPGSAILEPANTTERLQGTALQLPAELFGSEVLVEGKLNKVLPITGPQPDWDPDIVAALEGDNETFDLSEQLDDDFVVQANGGEPGIPVYVSEHFQDDENLDHAPSWWETRGDFTAPEENPQRTKFTSDQSDDSHDLGEKPARFTEYSMTSSVVPRSEALTLLDDQFEQFIVAYDDSEIGPGMEDGDEVTFDPTSSLLLQHAVEEFEKNFASLRDDENVRNAIVEECVEGECSDDGVDECSDSGDDSNSASGDSGDSVKLVEVVEAPKDQWDCESILSTYSTLYNHPARISEPSSSAKSKIKLSRKTGVPLETIAGPAPKEKLPKKMPIARPRDESREEKRARKQNTKEERRLRRADKKTTKLVFRSEELKQERALLGRHAHTIAVV